MSQQDEMDNRKKKMLEELEAAHGIVSTACQNANIARSTYYTWLQSDEDFKAAVEAVNESAIDFVESKLFEKINGVQLIGKDDEIYSQPPSDTAIIFYLKTKAKKRGYVERQEITGPEGESLTPPSINVHIIKPNE